MSGESDVAIFWDYENCHAAAHISGYEIVTKIRHIAHDFGSVKLFKAYLEWSEPAAYSKSSNLRSELQSSGVSLTDTPHNGRKDVADKMMLVDMLAHAIDNPPPATIILISGDRDFAYAVSILRSRRYRVVIISLGQVHISLKTQASIFLDWNTDVLGTEFDGHGMYSNICRNELHGISASSRPQMVLPNATSPLVNSQNRQISEGSDVGILHMRSDSFNAQKSGHEIEGKMSWGEIIPENVASSYRSRSNTQDSIYTDGSGTPTFRAPSRTESAPAAIFSSPNSTSPVAILETSHPPTNVATIPLQASTSANTKPVPDAVNVQQGMQKEESPIPRQHMSQPVAPVISMTASQVVASNVVQPIKYKTASLASPAPVPPTVIVPAPVGTPSASINAIEPKIVPPTFNLLVQRLEFHRLKGVFRPFRSRVAIELATQDNMLYRRAGTERFGQYVALAEKAGIIELGGKESAAWIALRPEWYEARLSP